MHERKVHYYKYWDTAFFNTLYTGKVIAGGNVLEYTSTLGYTTTK